VTHLNLVSTFMLFKNLNLLSADPKEAVFLHQDDANDLRSKPFMFLIFPSLP